MLKRFLSAGLAVSLSLTSLPAFSASSGRPTAGEWWTNIKSLASVDCDAHLTALTRGHLTHRDEGQRFSLDRQTVGDLDIASLLFPLYADGGSEILGLVRLVAMLQEVSVDSHEIRLRREAVRELENDETLLFDLRSRLRELDMWSKTDASTIAYVSGQRPEKALSVVREATGAGASAGLVGAIIYALYLYPEYYKDIANIAFLPGFMVVPLVMRQARGLAWHRNRHVEIKAAIEMAETIATRLAGAKSVRLREIASVLEQFNRKNYESPANPIVRSYLNLRGDRVPGMILNYSFISSLTLRHLNRKLEKHRQHILRLFSALSELSAFTSIATYGVSASGLTEPELLPDDHPAHIEIEDGHHPYVLWDQEDSSQTNDVRLSAEAGGRRAITLTGINGGGKSTVMRMISSLTLMAQTGSRVPAKRMRWTPAAIATNMTVTDSVKDRASYFEVQAARAAQLVAVVADQKNALIIMDEIFTGTSPEERSAGERTIMKYLAKFPGVLAILSSHDRKLSELTDQITGVTNMHVGDIGQPQYVLQEGVSKTRNAKDKLRKAGLPEEFLDMYQIELDRLLPPPPAGSER